jgi:hypothetical protein
MRFSKDRTMACRPRNDETGSALIMALLVLLFVAVVTTAALSYAGTSASTSGRAITPARTGRYDADSALQAALRYVEKDQSAGGSLGKDMGRPCPPSPGADPNATFTYTGASGPVTVYICPQVDSFNLEGNARAALLTLAGPNSGEGIDLDKNVDNVVNGDVWSNSYVALGSSSSMTVNGGKVWSWNTASCNPSGAITAPAGKDCSANATFAFSTLNGGINASQTSLTVASNAKFPIDKKCPANSNTVCPYVIQIEDELMLVTGGQLTNSWTVTRGYSGTTAAAHASNAAVRFMPKTGLDPGDPLLGHAADWQPQAAPGAIQVPTGCTLAPGVYTSGAALTARTTACTGGVTLLPGVYYLNFPAGDDTWTIGQDVTGACDPTTQEGAQLVFANQSKLEMAGGPDTPTLRLCGRRASPTAPQIAMTYTKTSTANGPSLVTRLRPTTATDTGSTPYTVGTPTKATPAGSASYPQDSPPSNATAILPKNANAELTLGNWSKLAADTAIPAGAVIDDVIVKAAHDEPSSATMTLSPVLTWGSCTATLAVTTSTSATLYTSEDLASTFSPCASVNPSTMTLEWRTSAPNSNSQPNWTTNIDGAQVEVTWHLPGVIAQTGCVTQLLSASGCPIITGPSNGQDAMDITGVVYLPRNRFTGVFKNGGSLKITEALIARSVGLDANPASVGSPIIGGPTNQFVLGKVVFQAFIAGANWTDMYATFNKDSFEPTINSWVIKR